MADPELLGAVSAGLGLVSSFQGVSNELTAGRAERDAAGIEADALEAAGREEDLAGREALEAAKAEQQAALARQRGKEHEAAQARQQAGQERATVQREAIEERRQAGLLASRALAVAAASGAGAGDPTVENILGEIGAEGEFRALSALFIGEERALGLETQADLDIFEGEQQALAGAESLRVGNVALLSGVRRGDARRRAAAAIRRSGDVALDASRGSAISTGLSGAARAVGALAPLVGQKTATVPRGSGRSPQRITSAGSGQGLARFGLRGLR